MHITQPNQVSDPISPIWYKKSIIGCPIIYLWDGSRGTVIQENIEIDEYTIQFNDGVVSAQPGRAFRIDEEYLNNLLSQLKQQFQKDFLKADAFVNQPKFLPLISSGYYEREKVSFVKYWVAENTPPDKNGQKHPPDNEQASTIAAVHGHVQVVARAGSGKTATLVNRAYFLQKHCGVKPSEIMLLAFNKKAAEEMEKRLRELLGENSQAPYVMTFHALAHALVHPEQNLIHDSPDDRNLALSRFVQEVVDDRLRNPEFENRIRAVMVDHFREDWDNIQAGGYRLGMEEMLQYRRSLQRETLGGDFVKSFGEKLIANFLFEHQVGYLYEPVERGWLKNYHPDFILKRGDGTGVAIEYFGMAGDPDYDEMSAQKRDYWRKRIGWTLIEFNPEDITENGVDGFQCMLQTELEKEGFAFKRMSEEEIWHQIRKRSVDRFTAVTRGFIARCRKLELTPESLQLRMEGDEARWQVEADFLEAIQPIYSDYLERLDIDDKEDFDGLMQRAAREVEEGKTSFSRYMKKQHGDLVNLRFMLIDEYQDFSKLFHSMVSAILSKNPGLQLFCVGDDWQAINGYAGSDLKYYKDFTTYFPSSERIHISTNYRSSAGIVEIGNAVMKRPGDKPALAHSTSVGSVWLAEKDNFQPSLTEGARHRDDKITPMVLRIVAKALVQGKDVVLLSRTNNAPGNINHAAHQGRDGDSQATGIERFGRLIRSYFPGHQHPGIKVSTVHGFKGLQAHVVVVLDAVAGCYPLIHQDWIFLRVLGENPPQITEESRRLFYVALTRAVDTLVIFTEKSKKSPFLEDIEKQKPLLPIRWSDYPPVVAQSERLLVMVGNQPHRGRKPTVTIKDFLKQEGYSPAKPDGKWFWVKSFPSENFSVESLRNSAWASNADGVEVRILDEQDNLVEKHFIDYGVWILQPNGH